MIKIRASLIHTTEDIIEKLLIMINEMKANSMTPQPDLFLQTQKSQNKKEKMATAIVILTIFVNCLVGSTWYCCQNYVKSNQTAVTVNTINETEKKYPVIKQNINVMWSLIK